MHASINDLDEEFNELNVWESELETFKYLNSGLSPEEYYLQYISIYSNYTKFFESAFFYYLETQLKKDKLHHFIFVFSGILVSNNIYTLILYKHLVKLNLFS